MKVYHKLELHWEGTLKAQSWSMLKAGTQVAIAVLASMTIAKAQATPPQPGQVQQRPPSVFGNLNTGKPAGPAPKRDFNGSWAGPIGSGFRNVPPMTPAGQAAFSLNKPESKYTLAGTNDPFVVCDPLGMPRKLTDQTRGVVFAEIPGRMLQLWQYDRVWREIWTDGRALPKHVGGKGEPDPRWFGYSTGHWENDNTFVAETNGADDRSWMDGEGHPHSMDMLIEERYTRKDHDTLDLDITLTDPKYYTAPIKGQNHFKWVPSQDLDEQICVPSEGIAYQNIIGIPAGDGTTKK